VAAAFEKVAAGGPHRNSPLPLESMAIIRSDNNNTPAYIYFPSETCSKEKKYTILIYQITLLFATKD
jgi:hypothetical protein